MTTLMSHFGSASPAVRSNGAAVLPGADTSKLLFRAVISVAGGVERHIVVAGPPRVVRSSPAMRGWRSSCSRAMHGTHPMLRKVIAGLLLILSALPFTAPFATVDMP